MDVESAFGHSCGQVPEQLSRRSRCRGAFGDHGQPSLGDLTEDLEEVLELLIQPQDVTFIWHDLGHLIGLPRLLRRWIWSMDVGDRNRADSGGPDYGSTVQIEHTFACRSWETPPSDSTVPA
jgi:hypothetical protein